MSFPASRLFIILKGDRIWGFDWYLVVCVITFSFYFGWKPHNQIWQLYSNNHALAENYLRENTISQLAGNRFTLVHLALWCPSYSQIDLDILEALQEITEHVYVLVCLLPSRRCAVHFSLATMHRANIFEGSYQGFNTTVTLVQICQNLRFSFSFRQNAYLGLVQGGASTIGIVVYWYVQRGWKLDSKKMARLLAVIVLY
jgi:hypothetical protein